MGGSFAGDAARLGAGAPMFSPAWLIRQEPPRAVAPALAEERAFGLLSSAAPRDNLIYYRSNPMNLQWELKQTAALKRTKHLK